LPSNLDEDDGPSADELDAVEGALKSLGLLESGLDESFDPQAVADALQKLRADYDLPLIDTAGLPAGAQILALYDEDLLYALTDPMSFRSASELSEK
jgi:putative chitinase